MKRDGGGRVGVAAEQGHGRLARSPPSLFTDCLGGKGWRASMQRSVHCRQLLQAQLAATKREALARHQRARAPARTVDGVGKLRVRVGVGLDDGAGRKVDLRGPVQMQTNVCGCEALPAGACSSRAGSHGPAGRGWLGRGRSRCRRGRACWQRPDASAGLRCVVLTSAADMPATLMP